MVGLPVCVQDIAGCACFYWPLLGFNSLFYYFISVSLTFRPQNLANRGVQNGVEGSFFFFFLNSKSSVLPNRWTDWFTFSCERSEEITDGRGQKHRGVFLFPGPKEVHVGVPGVVSGLILSGYWILAFGSGAPR